MTDSKQDIEKRLEGAVFEIKNYNKYDYVIINKKLGYALKELEAIIISHRSSAKMINPFWMKKNFLYRR
jgi:guanylate kinase